MVGKICERDKVFSQKKRSRAEERNSEGVMDVRLAESEGDWLEQYWTKVNQGIDYRDNTA